MNRISKLVIVIIGFIVILSIGIYRKDIKGQVLELYKGVVKDKRYIKDSPLSNNSSAKLLDSLSKVEFYQPLYNITLPEGPGIKYDIKRLNSSKERADVVLRYLGQNATLKSLNMLDIGSSLGYMDMYFGERGHKTFGIDASKDNVEVAKLLAELNQLPNVTFDVARFNASFVKEMKNSYDVAFLFSVLHHIIGAYGLENTQDLMLELLDKVPLLFVEFAVAEEKKTSLPGWKDNLPQDPLAVFAKCTDCQFELLGYFDTHVSDIKRPLYAIKKKSLMVDGQSYGYDSLKFLSYNHDSKNMDYRTRRYYTSDKYFIKEVITTDIMEKILSGNTISFYKANDALIKSLRVPELYAWEQKGERIRLVFEKVMGSTLAEKIAILDDKQKRDVAYQIIKIVSTIESKNVYQNDLRPWNFIVDIAPNGLVSVRIIDFDWASPVKTESSINAFLWTLKQLNDGKIEVLGSVRADLRDLPLSEYGIFADMAEIIIKNKAINMQELFLFFSENK
jgi:O-antigen chain-terminating bifunctional methyltransferase/kinase